MQNKLFVGGLSWSTDDDGLRQAFERFGSLLDAKVITDRETGRSRGFGFVTFDDADDAKAAIAEMDGTSLQGRQIKVNLAEEKPRSNGNRGGFGGGGGNRSTYNNSGGSSYGNSRDRNYDDYGGGGYGGGSGRNNDDYGGGGNRW